MGTTCSRDLDRKGVWNDPRGVTPRKTELLSSHRSERPARGVRRMRRWGLATLEPGSRWSHGLAPGPGHLSCWRASPGSRC